MIVVVLYAISTYGQGESMGQESERAKWRKDKDQRGKRKNVCWEDEREKETEQGAHYQNNYSGIGSNIQLLITSKTIPFGAPYIEYYNYIC